MGTQVLKGESGRFLLARVVLGFAPWLAGKCVNTRPHSSEHYTEQISVDTWHLTSGKRGYTLRRTDVGCQYCDEGEV